MKQAAILAIDDDPGTLLGLQEILETEGYEVTTAATGDAGLQLLQEHPFDLTLTDLAIPGTGGMEVLQLLRQHHPDCPCIIITGYGSISGAVTAMRQGAYHYLTKPVDAAELRLMVARALAHHYLKLENCN